MEVVLRNFQSNPAAAISAIVATVALISSIGAFVLAWKTRTTTLYSDIDARYMELLKLSIANAEFVNPEITKNYKPYFEGKDKELLAYEQYAYAAWNIVETIVDRRGKRQLRKTWFPVIKEENRLHRTWLNAEENQHKFKREFWDFMLKNNEAFPCRESEEGKERCDCKRCNYLRSLVKCKGRIRVLPRQLDAP